MFNDEDDFKKKREQYSLQIRSQNRQEIFNKRRNFQDPASEQKKQNPNENIIDMRIAAELKQLHNATYNEEMFGQYEAMLPAGPTLTNLKGLIAIRCLIDKQSTTCVEKFMKRGTIQYFLAFLRERQGQQTKLEAIWTIASLTYVENVCQYLRSHGIVKICTELLQNKYPQIVDHALVALGNISADGPELRDQVLKQNGLSALYNCMTSTTKISTFQNCVWAITNLCRGNPPPNPSLTENALPVLCRALQNEHFRNNSTNNGVMKIISDILWSLSNFSANSKLRVDRIIQQGTVPDIMRYLVHNHSQIYYPAIRIIGDIGCLGQKQTDALLQAGILDYAQKLLNHQKKTVRREICWILSNIAAGVARQVQKLVLRTSILDNIYAKLSQDDIDVKQEACWVFANIGNLGNKGEAVAVYMRYNLMPTYISLLDKESVQLQQNVLKCLHKMFIIGNRALYNNVNVVLNSFIQCGGVQKLEILQEHPSAKIYKLVVGIITQFFQVDAYLQ